MLLTDQEKTATLEVLNGDIYLNTKIRSYIFLRLNSWLAAQGAVYQHDVITVEHVMPQTVSTGSDWEKD